MVPHAHFQLCFMHVFSHTCILASSKSEVVQSGSLVWHSTLPVKSPLPLLSLCCFLASSGLLMTNCFLDSFSIVRNYYVVICCLPPILVTKCFHYLQAGLPCVCLLISIATFCLPVVAVGTGIAYAMHCDLVATLLLSEYGLLTSHL